MVPAYKCLDASNLSGFKVYLWLVMQLKLVSFQCTPQTGLQSLTPDGLDVHVLLEEAVIVAPMFLGVIHGVVRILAASTEIGQGTNTIFSQIAGEALGISYDLIEIAQPDTGVVPNSGPTVASRTSMVVGKLVETAALGLKRTLLESGLLCDACTEDEFVHACRRYIETRGPLRSRSQYEAPPGLHWDDATYSGDAYGTFAWAVYVAEVAVDAVTFEARVTDFVAGLRAPCAEGALAWSSSLNRDTSPLSCSAVAASS